MKVSKADTKHIGDSSNIAEKDLRNTGAWLMNYRAGRSAVARTVREVGLTSCAGE